MKIDINRSSEQHTHVYAFTLGRALPHLLRVSKYDESIPLVTIIAVQPIYGRAATSHSLVRVASVMRICGLRTAGWGGGQRTALDCPC